MRHSYEATGKGNNPQCERAQLRQAELKAAAELAGRAP